MFKSLDLQPTYSSYEVDIGSAFYAPVLNESIRYDRAAAYFSAKALARYGKGLETFGRKGSHMRLIISAEVDRISFEEMKAGYQYRKDIDQSLVAQLREHLNLEEERNISNLAYLIALGIIDIRIAFTPRGIFHDKFGIVEDECGERICFRGSNNETTAAFEMNYEAFDITCSWQASAFDYEKITKSQEIFERLWDNRDSQVCVRNVSDVVYHEIQKYNRGEIIYEELQLETECVLLDYAERLKLNIKINPETILNSSTYKLRLRRYVDQFNSKTQILWFKSELTYLHFKKVVAILEKDAKNKGYRFFITNRLKDYIASRELYIKERSRIGIAIKKHSSEMIAPYMSYKSIVDKAFSRPLREQQMWDSFFLCSMKKASNFSVPGSGKTASVLGVFAYLLEKNLVDRLVMVGPKNSFGSWQDEFNLCFGEKLPLKVFNIQDECYKSVAARKTALLFESGSANLVLLNYECLRTYLDEVKKLMNHRALLVFDEVHKVKAIEGSKACRAMELARESDYTIALTGTPIPNSYTDIRNLLDILYHDEYDEFFGFDILQLRHPSESEMDEINRKLQPFFCRTTKEQLSVPPASPEQVCSVNASEAENVLFQILCKKYAKNKLALIVRLLQLESDPKMLLKAMDLSDFADILDISGDVEEIDYVDYSEDVRNLVESIRITKKFSACINKALELYHEGKPQIIWCIFVDSIFRISNELQEKGLRVACISGMTTMEERQRIIEDFREGKLDTLITNPHTLAESVSLHKTCHDAIYFEYSYNLVHLLQSKDRIHRLGLPDGQYTQYYYMQERFFTEDNADYSLDEHILIRLQEKEHIMLEAIENQKLERGCTTQEDLDLIFGTLHLPTSS